MKQIVPGVYTFTGLIMGRSYLIDDPDGCTIIDAGLELATRRILDQLAASGRAPRTVKRILITHAHSDHIGGLASLKRETGAAVMASPLDRPIIEGQVLPTMPTRDSLPPLWRGVPFTPPKTAATVVDQEINDGDVLSDILGGLKVIATPGHSAGHLSFWQPERRLLFCGDVILRLPNLRLPFALFTPDMAENKRSIKKLAALEPAVVCFGHGQPLTEDTPRQIRAFAATL